MKNEEITQIKSFIAACEYMIQQLPQSFTKTRIKRVEWYRVPFTAMAERRKTRKIAKDALRMIDILIELSALYNSGRARIENVQPLVREFVLLTGELHKKVLRHNV